MKILLTGVNMDIPDYMPQLVEKKLAHNLEKILTNVNQQTITADLIIEKHTRWGYVLKFTVLLPKKKRIFAKSHQKDFLLCLTDLREKLEHQIKKAYE